MASVDIAIPSYQYGRYLRTCVESVLSQEGVALRVLIIDNASTDDSLDVARQLANEDARVEVRVHHSNVGPHASFNEGIDWASADYFLILCADDFLVPHALSRAVDVMERHPNVGLTYGRAHRLGESDEAPRDSASSAAWDVQPGAAAFERFCTTGICPVLGCTAVVRTMVQKQAGHYRPSLPHTDDFELWMRFAAIADVATTDTVQAVIRVHDAARSRSEREHLLRDIESCQAAFDSFFGQEGRRLASGSRLSRIAHRSLAARAYWAGLSHLCRGLPIEGSDLLRYAFRKRPSTAIAPPLWYLLSRGDLGSRIDRLVGGLAAAALVPAIPW